MTYTYEEVTFEIPNSKMIKRTDENGLIVWIPLDPANADYQAYLNPEVKADEAKTK